MNKLKYWVWALLMAAALLLFYLWIEYPLTGPKFSMWENVELVVFLLAIVCLLLAVTVWIIYKALNQDRN